MRKETAQLIGVFHGLTLENSINTYYQDKFKQNFLTEKSTITFDDLTSELKSLSIVDRNAKAVAVTTNGFTRTSIKPDVIKGYATLTTDELYEMQAGQAPIYLNGEILNNATLIEDKKLKILKYAYIKTKEEIATELYLTGKIVLPESKDTFSLEDSEKIEKTFSTSKDDFGVFLTTLVDDYVDKNKIAPTNIELGLNVFTELMKNERFAGQVRAYNHAQIINGNGTQNDVYPTFNILGYTVRVLPRAYGLEGKIIDTSNLIILSNTTEFTNVYAGIGAVEGGNMKVFRSDVLIQKLTEQDPASVKYLLQSAYFPIIPIPKRVVRYNTSITK